MLTSESEEMIKTRGENVLSSLNRIEAAHQAAINRNYIHDCGYETKIIGFAIIHSLYCTKDFLQTVPIRQIGEE